MTSATARAAMLAATAILAATEIQAQDPPLPLDPLTAQERALADEVARSDSRVREFLAAGRSRHIYTDFISIKEPRVTDVRSDVPSRRHAEALFYNCDRREGLRALVDLSERRVVDVARVPGQSVPINAEEVAEAARLALADQRVVRLFGNRMPAFRAATGPATREDLESARIEGLRLAGAGQRDPCTRGRCIMLFFRVNNRYVQMNRVSVDLTTQQVLIRGGER